MVRKINSHQYLWERLFMQESLVARQSKTEGVLTGLPLGPSSPGGPLGPGGPAAPEGPASPFSPLSPLGPCERKKKPTSFYYPGKKKPKPKLSDL